ncbi:MAG: hypothetical protein WC825_10635 [Gallionellaceae bacterium]|jgi:hypothetical protein
MTARLITSTLRVLLVVLISTFMSPSFSWEMMDSHSEEANLSVMGDTAHSEVIEAHHHHHGGEDDAAHSQIGHLLSHLPAVMHRIEVTNVSVSTSTVIPIEVCPFVQADTIPPYKPPRNVLFV